MYNCIAAIKGTTHGSDLWHILGIKFVSYSANIIKILVFTSKKQEIQTNQFAWILFGNGHARAFAHRLAWVLGDGAHLCCLTLWLGDFRPGYGDGSTIQIMSLVWLHCLTLGDWNGSWRGQPPLTPRVIWCPLFFAPLANAPLAYTLCVLLHCAHLSCSTWLWLNPGPPPSPPANTDAERAAQPGFVRSFVPVWLLRVVGRRS